MVRFNSGRTAGARSSWALIFLGVVILAPGLAWGDRGSTSSDLASPTDVAAKIDTTLAAEMGADEPFRPTEVVDDFRFLRRVSLDLVGRPPTAGEIERFVRNPSADKRSVVVEQLLSNPEFGENWARYWRDVILYRRSENRALLVSESAKRFLASEFNRETPWDEIVKAFVTTEGNVVEDGSTAIVMAQAGRPEETVAEISRIFMGIQIQCAQCHDHPWDRWKREQFHELAAFYPRVSLRPVLTEMPRGFAVVGTDFLPRRKPKNDRYVGMLEHHMPDLDDPEAPGTLMQPKFFIGDLALRPGVPDKARRDALAEWLTSDENEWFAKSYANRIWSELTGAGFYEPIDDIGPDRDCVAPKTLDLLTGRFVATGYDVKDLLRVVMRTNAYQRESRSRAESGPSDFQSTHPQRLRSDQLYNALLQLLEVPNAARMAPRGGASGYRRGRRDPSVLFSLVFGFDPSDLRHEVSGSVPQSLMLMNSKLLTTLMGTKRMQGLGGLLRQYPDDSSAVQALYLRALSRPPTSSEVKVSLQYVRASDRRDEAFEDLLWALINSSEFVHRT